MRNIENSVEVELDKTLKLVTSSNCPNKHFRPSFQSRTCERKNPRNAKCRWSWTFLSCALEFEFGCSEINCTQETASLVFTSAPWQMQAAQLWRYAKEAFPLRMAIGTKRRLTAAVSLGLLMLCGFAVFRSLKTLNYRLLHRSFEKGRVLSDCLFPGKNMFSQRTRNSTHVVWMFTDAHTNIPGRACHSRFLTTACIVWQLLVSFTKSSVRLSAPFHETRGHFKMKVTSPQWTDKQAFQHWYPGHFWHKKVTRSVFLWFPKRCPVRVVIS